MKKYDAVIIGFGKGGKTLAAHLAGKGKTVAVIEKSDRMYGGSCVNVACIPTKFLIGRAKETAAQGGTFEDKALRYSRAIAEKDALTAELRKNNYDKLNGLGGVTIITGNARFLSSKRLEVKVDGKPQEIEGGMFFINTGSVPLIPSIDGLQGNRYVYTSETLMQLAALPKRLVIIGGGYIGMEFASMYTDFGSHVTVIQDGKDLLPREDDDIVREIRRILEEKGVTFRLGAHVRSVREQTQAAAVSILWEGAESTLTADAVLVAKGRVPNTEALGPDAAGIEKTERGGIKTDSLLRTSAPGIWAMGDVRGGLQFTYISLDDFRIVWSQIGDGPAYSLEERKNVPNSMFIDPPLSTVGLKEKEARAAGRNIRISKVAASSLPRAKVTGEAEGFLKAVIDADTEQILGVSLLCAESYEMVNLAKLAIDMGMDSGTLYMRVFTHPAMSEGFNDLFAPVK